MAEVPVTINGVICDLYGRTIMGPVKIVGSLMKSGVTVGGGPILPEEPPAGPGDAHPEHPIYYPPGTQPHPEHPIVLPGDPSWPGGDPHPEHPIVLPPPNLPTEPPSSGTKPPPAGEAGWGFYDGRWGYFPGPGEAQPKR